MIALTMTNTAIDVWCPRVAALRAKKYVVTDAIAEKVNGDVHDRVPYPQMWPSLKHVLIPTIASMFPSVSDVMSN